MPPGHVGGIARWILLIERDVADQRRASIRALDQIVTENGVLRKIHAPSFKRIDLVDPFSNE